MEDRVKMPVANKPVHQQPTAYATAADFCRIFAKDMNRLYLLSLLLTADESDAESCFVQGLETSGKNSRVFKEWAESWARRTIVQNAIHMVRPRAGASVSGSFYGTGKATHIPAELAAVVELPIFERFVFVITVLEGYSEQECSLLLDCTRGEVGEAKVRALEQVGNSQKRRHGVDESNGSEHRAADDSEPRLTIKALSHLAATA
jgi:DNA-directed RNA polymerase specialized sigma24 family protein